MRILMLEPNPSIQSPLPKIVPLLTTALRDAGVEVTTGRWGRHSDTETWRDKIWGRISDIYQVRAALKRNRFDALFVPTAHDWKTLARDLMLLITTRGLYRSAVVQIHGSLLERIEATGHAGFKVVTRMLFGLSDAVIVSSRREQEVFSRFMPSGRSRFFVADNVYQPAPRLSYPAIPDAWELPSDRPIILFAGRLIPEKGILDLLAAMPLVLKSAPCHLLIAGVGPLEADVQKTITLPCLQGSISWIRYLDQAHLELAYSLAAIFVLPTYHIEGFPAVIQDALGHGIPIVTTPIRGVADHLVDGVHGRLVPSQDPDALAAAVVDLLGNPALRARVSETNREKAGDFSSEKVGRRYLEILQQVVCPRQGVHEFDAATLARD